MIRTLEEARKRFNSIKKAREEARAGEIWSVNNKAMRGHKGQILKRHGNRLEVAEFTHSKKYGNLPMVQNPQSDDPEKAYLVRKKQYAKVRNLGRYHPDMVVKHPSDKSKIRHIKKRK